MMAAAAVRMGYILCISFSAFPSESSRVESELDWIGAEQSWFPLSFHPSISSEHQQHRLAFDSDNIEAME